MKKSCFKGCFCSKKVKVKSCFPHPWRERVGGARERGEAYGGFTLVELLVVVLIIGILAAVALPQYKMAVYKSKYAQLKTLVHVISQAQELYYLANSDYADKLNKLDINFPAGQDPDTSTPTRYYYTWGECYINAGVQVICNNVDIKMGYQLYTQHPQGYEKSAGARMCVATATRDLNAIQNRICKTETGSDTPYRSVGKTGIPYSSWTYSK